MLAERPLYPMSLIPKYMLGIAVENTAIPNARNSQILRWVFRVFGYYGHWELRSLGIQVGNPTPRYAILITMQQL